MNTILVHANDDEYKYIKPISIETLKLKKSSISLTKSTEHSADIIDTDGDGVADEKDRCKKTAKESEVDINGCELDNDKDGIVNSKDQCPDTKNDFLVDAYGCPQTATLKVNFQANSADISQALIEQLKEFADFLKNNESYHVIIYGYTDNSGDELKNQKLSQDRAITVKKALVKHGINDIRLTAIGRGSENPIADNTSYDGRVKNRRIEVELLH